MNIGRKLFYLLLHLTWGLVSPLINILFSQHLGELNVPTSKMTRVHSQDWANQVLWRPLQDKLLF